MRGGSGTITHFRWINLFWSLAILLPAGHLYAFASDFLILKEGRFAASRRIRVNVASWFETAQPSPHDEGKI
jgi:hypothetical protein